MFNKARIRQDFNRAAEGYDNHATLQRHVANNLFQQASPLLTAADTILDIGCGTGYFQELARKYQHRWTIYQLDLAYNMCAIAKRYASLPEYGDTFTINAECESLPLSDNSINVIFSSLMIQWVDNLPQSFAETYRVLNKNGIYCFSTFLPGTLHELAASFEHAGFHSPTSPFHGIEHHVELLEKAGFTTIETHTESCIYHYDNLLSLMRALKGIGAQNKTDAGKQRFIGKAGLHRIENAYQHHFGNTIPASWEILYIIARKN